MWRVGHHCYLDLFLCVSVDVLQAGSKMVLHITRTLLYATFMKNNIHRYSFTRNMHSTCMPWCNTLAVTLVHYTCSAGCIASLTPAHCKNNGTTCSMYTAGAWAACVHAWWLEFYLILWLQHGIKLTKQLIQWLPSNIGKHIETTPVIKPSRYTSREHKCHAESEFAHLYCEW